MRNSKFSLIAISLLFFLLTSCSGDFLYRNTPDSLPEDGFYNSSDRAVAAVNAVYSTLQSDNLFGDYFSKIFTGSSGDAILSNTTGTEFVTFSYSASDPILFAVYSQLYQGVYRANKALAEIPGIDMDASLKSRLLGEAKFLRALYYFYLTTLWGDVPLYTKPFKTPDDALVAKSSMEDIRAVMIQDLKDAAQALPVSYNESNVGRATKGAAEALLGKVYLYQKEYDKAAIWLKKVIDLANSGVYGLVDNYNYVFNRTHENNKESIFEVQFKYVGSEDVQTLRDWYNLPQGEPGGFGNDQPTQSIVDAFEHYSGPSAINGRDPRLFYSIFRDGDPFLPNSSNPDLRTYNKGWSITGYNLKKGMLPIKLVSHGTGTNFPVIRYAGVLLMYAEAENALDNRDLARDAVNKVRQRPSVLMPKLTKAETNTKEKMFKAIVHERRVELAFEFQRYNDLRRWGLAKQVLGSQGYTERNRYFPLPQDEIDTNPKLKQRSGW